jgi:hypothetical protein
MTRLIGLGSWSNCFSGQRSWPTDLAWNITDLLSRSNPAAGKESYLNAVSQELHFDWRKATWSEGRNCPLSLGFVLEQR